MTSRQSGLSFVDSAQRADAPALESAGESEPGLLAAGQLRRLLSSIINDVERLESAVALHRGVIGRMADYDPDRLERETSRLAGGIDATAASLRRALLELRHLDLETTDVDDGG